MATFISILIVLGIIVFLFKDSIKETFSPDKTKNYTIDDRYNAEKREREKEIDRILGKMGKNGVNDLSEKDKKRLDELSKK